MSALRRVGPSVRISYRLLQPLSRGFGSAASPVDLSEKPLAKINSNSKDVIGDPMVKRHVYTKPVGNPYISMGTLVRQDFSPNSSLYQKKMLSGLIRTDLEGLRMKGFNATGQVSHMSTVAQGISKPKSTHNQGKVPVLHLLMHMNEGIREVIVDYVHHEMTREMIMICLRLFLIISLKDVFVSLLF